MRCTQSVKFILSIMFGNVSLTKTAHIVTAKTHHRLTGGVIAILAHLPVNLVRKEQGYFDFSSLCWRRRVHYNGHGSIVFPPYSITMFLENRFDMLATICRMLFLRNDSSTCGRWWRRSFCYNCRCCCHFSNIEPANIWMEAVVSGLGEWSHDFVLFGCVFHNLKQGLWIG